jgi:hypothetical protein
MTPLCEFLSTSVIAGRREMLTNPTLQNHLMAGRGSSQITHILVTIQKGYAVAKEEPNPSE